MLNLTVHTVLLQRTSLLPSNNKGKLTTFTGHCMVMEVGRQSLLLCSQPLPGTRLQLKPTGWWSYSMHFVNGFGGCYVRTYYKLLTFSCYTFPCHSQN